MTISQLLPWIIAAIVALVALRFVMGAIKTSVKTLLWLILVAAAIGGWMWWKANNQSF